MNIKRIVCCILLGASSLAYAADLSRWHEVLGGAWQVDRSLWQEMKDQIQIAANSPRRGETVVHARRDVSNFYVQLQGLSEGDQKRVRLIGSCDLPFAASVESLDSRWNDVDDGGDCYFDAVFDPVSRRFVSFSFHGVA